MRIACANSIVLVLGVFAGLRTLSLVVLLLFAGAVDVLHRRRSEECIVPDESIW